MARDGPGRAGSAAGRKAVAGLLLALRRIEPRERAARLYDALIFAVLAPRPHRKDERLGEEESARAQERLAALAAGVGSSSGSGPALRSDNLKELLEGFPDAVLTAARRSLDRERKREQRRRKSDRSRERGGTARGGVAKADAWSASGVSREELMGGLARLSELEREALRAVVSAETGGRAEEMARLARQHGRERSWAYRQVSLALDKLAGMIGPGRG